MNLKAVCFEQNQLFFAGLVLACLLIAIPDARAQITIRSQPRNKAASPGSNVTFQVTATTTTVPPDLSYQWFLNGTDLTTANDPRISGADSPALTISNLSSNDSGSCRVIVSDANGHHVQSTNAALVVISAVRFADVNLEAAIDAILGQAFGLPLTPEAMSGLTSVEVTVESGAFSLDLQGMEYADNLTSFTLQGDDMVTLTNTGVISALTSLQQLTVDSFSLGSPDFVINLAGLQYLELDDDQITNISPVANLSALIRLAVDNNSISTFPSPVSLPNLGELDMNGNPIQDLAFISEVPSVQVLGMSDTRIQDISPLVFLGTNLLALGLNDDNLTNPDLLVNFTSLFDLYLNGTPICDVNFLKGKTKLTNLALNSDTNLVDLSGLTNAPNINNLDISSIPARDFTPVSNLKKLSLLTARNDHLSSIAFLTPLNISIALTLDNNPLSDLSPLAGMKALPYLSAQGDLISNLTPLGGLTNLQNLLLSGNLITNISGLTGATNLQNLFLDKNRLQGINSLTNLAVLRHVNLTYNLLNTNSSSPALQIVAGLQNRSVQVDFLPQNIIPYLTGVGLAGKQFQFTINGSPGQILQVQRSTNLLDWLPLMTMTNSSGTTQVPNLPTADPRQFYRLLGL